MRLSEGAMKTANGYVAREPTNPESQGCCRRSFEKNNLVLARLCAEQQFSLWVGVPQPRHISLIIPSQTNTKAMHEHEQGQHLSQIHRYSDDYLFLKRPKLSLTAPAPSPRFRTSKKSVPPARTGRGSEVSAC